MKKYTEDPIGQDRTGDILYLCITFIMACFFLPTFCQAQCWQKVFEHSCFTQDICDFQAQITPEADYRFLQGYIWIKAEKCTHYNLVIGGAACDGVCDQGEFTQLNYDSNCCTHQDFDTIYECGDFEQYDYYERSYNCQCDTVRQVTVLPSQEYLIRDTIPHLTNDITVDSLLTVLGCDSIIITHWIATDFEDEGTVNNQEPDTDDDGETVPKLQDNIDDVTETGDERLEDKIEPLKVYFPNIISPDGNGINDCFQTFTNGAEIQKVVIADRWGNLISEIENINSGDCAWDGHYRGAKMKGVFIYVALIDDKVFKGDFTCD